MPQDPARQNRRYATRTSAIYKPDLRGVSSNIQDLSNMLAAKAKLNQLSDSDYDSLARKSAQRQITSSTLRAGTQESRVYASQKQYMESLVDILDIEDAQNKEKKLAIQELKDYDFGPDPGGSLELYRKGLVKQSENRQGYSERKSSFIGNMNESIAALENIQDKHMEGGFHFIAGEPEFTPDVLKKLGVKVDAAIEADYIGKDHAIRGSLDELSQFIKVRGLLKSIDITPEVEGELDVFTMPEDMELIPLPKEHQFTTAAGHTIGNVSDMFNESLRLLESGDYKTAEEYYHRAASARGTGIARLNAQLNAEKKAANKQLITGLQAERKQYADSVKQNIARSNDILAGLEIFKTGKFFGGTETLNILNDLGLNISNISTTAQGTLNFDDVESQTAQNILSILTKASYGMSGKGIGQVTKLAREWVKAGSSKEDAKAILEAIKLNQSKFEKYDDEWDLNKTGLYDIRGVPKSEDTNFYYGGEDDKGNALRVYLNDLLGVYSQINNRRAVFDSLDLIGTDLMTEDDFIDDALGKE